MLRRPLRPAADPLVGNWDTGPCSSKDYGGSKFEFNVRFYDEGGVPYVVMTGWDPTKGTMPQDGDHGPYKLLANNRLAIASIDDPVYRHDLFVRALRRLN